MRSTGFLAGALFFISIAAGMAEENKKPESFYIYYDEKTQLLPLSDKGFSYEDAMRKERIKDFKFGRPRPEASFEAAIKTDKTGNIDKEEVDFDVMEESGVERDAAVRFGFPLPEGGVFDPAKIKIVDSAKTEIPAQIEATAFWKDSSIKWALVQFGARLKANEKKMFKVVFGSKVQAEARKSKLRLVESPSDATIYTGPLKAHIDKRHFNVLKSVWFDRNGDGVFADGEKIGGFSANGIELLDENFNLFTSAAAAPESFSIEEQGSETIVLKIKGQYAKKSDPYKKLMNYTVRLTFHKDSPIVKVAVTHVDTNIQNEFTDITSLGLELTLPENAEALTATVAKSPALEILGKGNFFQFDDKQILSGGRKQDGKLNGAFGIAMKNGKVALAIRDCWQRWPKAVGIDGKSLSIGLLPEQPSKNYGRNLPHYLQFPFCEGKYRMKWGMSFTEEILLDFAGASPIDKIEAESNMPVVAVINPEWHAKTQALSGTSFPIGKQFAIWDNAISKAFDAHMQIKDEQREYGFFNYGDCYGERGKNWNNNEYDFAHGLFMDFVRTGNRNHFRWAMKAARHQADVDCVHAYPDAYYIGSNHMHAIGHTGGYTHLRRTGWSSLYDLNEDGRNGHTWVNGMIDAWCMGGDPIPMNAAYGVGEQIVWGMLTNFTHLGDHERSAGWSLRAISSLYRFTNDQLYLNAADKIADVAMREQKMDCGAWPHVLPLGHADPENPRSAGNCPYLIGILLNGLKAYHEATGNPDAAKSIIAGAAWLEKAWNRQACGWPYSASPEGKPYWRPKPSPLNILICTPMSYAANISDNKAFMKTAEEAFFAGIMSFSPKGKNFAYGLLFSSELLCELQKWHLKNSEDKGASLLSSESNLLEFMKSCAGSDLNLRMPQKKTVLVSLKNEKAIVKATAKKHGKSLSAMDKGMLTLKGPNGSTISQMPFDIKKSFGTELEIKGKPGDIFTIEVVDDMSNIWNFQSDDANVSAMIQCNSSIGNIGFSAYYFFVPAKTKEFEISLVGIYKGRFGGIVVQPDGKVNSFIEKENHGETQLSEAVDNFKNFTSSTLKMKAGEGLDNKNWKLVVWAPQDISIEFKGIPPYISSKDAFIPVELAE